MQQGVKTHGTNHQPQRRNLLKGLAISGGAILAAPALAKADGNVTVAPIGTSSLNDRQPFYGARQSGIVNARPAHGMIASFDVIADTPDELEDLLKRLTDRMVVLTHGGTVEAGDPKLPPPDSGILGPVFKPDNLTITLSFGASLFEKRPWLAALKPKSLRRMPEFRNDALLAEQCHGDIALQFCANTQDTNIHALRDILKNLPDRLVINWKQEGAVPVVPPRADGVHENARNFLGFIDGSANPNASDSSLMEKLVWVGADDDEPAWALNGTYQAVRIIRNFVERWDRTPLGEQERIFGRRKMNGAPMSGGSHESDVPDFANDPDGVHTPLDSHIRLANPRNPHGGNNLILRRPFNYSNGVARSGHLDQGLLFICYQANLDQGFIAVQHRLDGEPLEEYIKPVGGGFFFVLPGVAEEGGYLGQTLIAALKT